VTSVESSLEKGLGVIEYLAQQGSAQGVSEIARACGLAKTTAHRLLQLLRRTGYINKRGDPARYFLSLKLWTLANQGLVQFDIREVAKPHLYELSRKTRESVHLSVLDDETVVFIDKVEGDHPIQAVTTLGARGPGHCLATGKAILAFTEASYFEGRFRVLKSFTARTLRTRADLLQSLIKVREQGYAVSDREWFESIVGIAAPVLDAGHRPIAAVGIAGPAERLAKRTWSRIGAHVRAAAAEISHTIGSRR